LGRNGPDVVQPVGLQAGWLIVDAWDYGHLDYLGAGPKAMPLPVDIPKQGTAKPASKPAWSAAFVSSRFRRA